jgi:hypothetical protein
MWTVKCVYSNGGFSNLLYGKMTEENARTLAQELNDAADRYNLPLTYMAVPA